MVRFSKYKHSKVGLLSFLLPILMLLGSQTAAALAKPGCYSDYSASVAACPAPPTYDAQGNPSGGTPDTNGNPVDGSKYCYLATKDSSGQMQYQEVSCAEITSGSSNHSCGGPGQEVHTSIDLGCKGKGNPIIDMTFGIIRFLSYGVGFVVVASIVVAGIQYTTSQGDPKAAAAAEKRIKSTVVALLIYIFAYAILNYVIPQGFLSQ